MQKWGEGASMVRREWKPREGEQNKHTKDEGGGMTVDHNEEEEVEDSSSEEEVKEVDMEESEKTPRPTIKPLHPVSHLRVQKLRRVPVRTWMHWLRV